MKLRLLAGMVALVLSASTVAAQQPQTPPSDRHPGMAGGDKMSMMMMDSLNHRLDSLVARMNRTSGNQKVTAMAAVINEMVAQRKAMQDRMHQMMEHGGMMMNESTSTGPKPTAKPDSATTDTTNHATHHPPK